MRLKKFLAAAVLGLALFASGTVGAQGVAWSGMELVCRSGAVTAAERVPGYYYPRFRFADKTVATRINDCIETAVEAIIARNNDDTKLADASVSCEISYENERYLTLCMESRTYRAGSPGAVRREFFTFDPATGARLKYTDFIPALTAAEMRYAVETGMVAPYSLYGAADFGGAAVQVADADGENFYPVSDGVVLVFSSGALGDQSMGESRIALTAEQANKIKKAYSKVHGGAKAKK